MTDGQWTVFGLLLLLLFMELLRSPSVASFIKAFAFIPFKQAGSN